MDRNDGRLKRPIFGVGDMIEVQKQKTFHDDWFSKSIPDWDRYLAHLKGKPNVQALEIGSWEGQSTCWLLENILTDPSSRITCIDTFTGNPENIVQPHYKDVKWTFASNIRATGAEEKVELIEAPSQLALKLMKNDSCDFIYIDGSHDPKDVLTDIVLSWGLLKHGGIMILDDYPLQIPKLGILPKRAIDAFYFVFKDDIIDLHTEWQAIWRKI